MPEEVVKRRLEVCDPPLERKTIGGRRYGVGGFTPEVNNVAVRFTLPENPFRLVSVTRTVALEPAAIEMNEGFELIVKSG